MKAKVLLFLALLGLTAPAMAQRKVDQLDRGLIAMKMSTGVFLSWRILGEEYYDVQYNVYRDGTKLNATPLSVSNYRDASGTVSSTYTVKAVVRGVEQEASKTVQPWATTYKEIALAHEGIKSTLIPNDACCADVDGDGELEILMKFDNLSESSNYMQKDGYFGEYSIFEVLKMDGTRLWWVNCGPNMGDFQNNEQNIVGYDWDCDGKAEVVMRLEEGSVIHMADGNTYTIGSNGKNGTSWTNYREARWVTNGGATVAMAFNLSSSATATCSASWVTTSIKDGVLSVTASANTTGANRWTSVFVKDGTKTTEYPFGQYEPGAESNSVSWFTHYGNEFLVYCNGETGEPYVVTAFPLKRLEDGETDLEKAWGDGYGHRSSKFFFGAPYLDGKKPSIFLARGIYTRHKMIAYDVNPTTHALTVRWRWDCNANGPWKGNGYHNYGIADVDWDGRDEIVFGSMVIDDNGKGLSTTGFGHGDAQHCSDFNPYVHGQEIYACLEHSPNWGNNYRDATTSKVYHHHMGGRDDGRCMAGNFTNSFPGALGCSATEGAISTITAEAVSGLGATGVNTNFRIYWDGDLCSETFNYVNGKNTEGCVAKYGSWSPIYTMTGSMTNNDTKGTPCYQGDILGDWREEVIMRTANNNIRIYSTTVASSFPIYSLWHDHQYRNAMVWQMCGYNQPPHTSYFLGEMEGITLPPPPLTMTGRTEVADGGTIGSALNGLHAIVCETKNSSVTLEAGAKPAVLTFNVPTWVQGSAPSECTTQNTKITYTTYTCNVTGGGLAGDARLVKQGDGILNLPAVDFTHTGNTDLWAGVVNFNGNMPNSAVWLNRFAEFNANGAFKSIKADYASVLRPGGADVQGSITADAIDLGFGARVVIDLYSDGFKADKLVAKTISFEHKKGIWVTAGPSYLTPVIEIVGHPASGKSTMEPGKYVIAEVSEGFTGTADDIILEGLSNEKRIVYIEDNKLIVEFKAIRDKGSVVWTGVGSAVWELAGDDDNFTQGDEGTYFVSGDDVLFDDNAAKKNITVTGNVSPTTFTVNSTAAYTFGGDGVIEGNAVFYKEGTGTVTMNGANSYTGGNHLKGGTVKVSALANQYSDVGNLGGITTKADMFTIEDGAVLQTTAAVEQASPMKMVGTEGGVINNSADFRMEAALSGTQLTKRGAGCLFVHGGSSLSRMIIAAGSVAETSNPASTVEFQGGTLYDDAACTSHAIYVPKGKTGTWHLTYTYYIAYNNKVTGEGTLNIIPRNSVSRVRITGDWSQFEGTIKHTNTAIWLPLDMSTGMPKGTLDIAEGCGVCNTAKAFTVGQLTGKGSLVQAGPDFKSSTAVSGNNTWNVGNSNDKNFTFAGIFTDNGGSNKVVFNKIGTCKMTVSGKSNHSGGTTVQGGELHFNAGATLGTGTLTVNKGAILSGVTATTPLTNSATTLKAGAILQVGANASATTGLIDFGGKNVTIPAGAFLQLGLSRAAVTNATTGAITNTGGTSLQNINKLTMSGTIQLHYSVSFASNVKVGDVVYLWKDVTTFTGNPVLESEVIDAEKGLFWDTTDIKQGILRVTDVVPVGIRGIAEEAGEAPTIYTLDGRPVSNPRRGNVYIINGRKVLMR
ncbi:MAG: autotransporter-associated beta strand repeat-containing protein [Bacteroidaceae bacterium]|nr:autotransporter-associated beta strand repeat-containing protein [Bacteroidaceae bacterium]